MSGETDDQGFLTVAENINAGRVQTVSEQSTRQPHREGHYTVVVHKALITKMNAHLRDVGGKSSYSE